MLLIFIILTILILWVTDFISGGAAGLLRGMATTVLGINLAVEIIHRYDKTK